MPEDPAAVAESAVSGHKAEILGAVYDLHGLGLRAGGRAAVDKAVSAAVRADGSDGELQTGAAAGYQPRAAEAQVHVPVRAAGKADNERAGRRRDDPRVKRLVKAVEGYETATRMKLRRVLRGRGGVVPVKAGDKPAVGVQSRFGAGAQELFESAGGQSGQRAGGEVFITVGVVKKDGRAAGHNGLVPGKGHGGIRRKALSGDSGNAGRRVGAEKLLRPYHDALERNVLRYGAPHSGADGRTLVRPVHEVRKRPCAGGGEQNGGHCPEKWRIHGRLMYPAPDPEIWAERS